jgi:hypothetical protein
MKPMVRGLMALAVALGLGVAPARAESDRLRIALSAWPAGLSGTQEVDGDTLDGSTADLASTLGLDAATLPDLHMQFSMLGPFNIVGSYFTSSYEGEETLAQSLTFDDVVYSASEQLRSSVDLEFGKVMMSFTVLNTKRIGLGLLVGANLMDLRSQVESAASGQAQKGISTPMPTVGVNLRLQPLKKLLIYAELSGFNLEQDGVDASSIDGQVRLEYFFVPWIGITGSFRILDLNVNDPDFGNVDFQQDGGRLGVVFRL